jgi:chemotaxis protein MotB
MAPQRNAAPVLIRRKKVIGGGGHHGGAWKVAYADFVTAMMAFFLLMWLLNATTEKQRKGLADYFNPTIPVNRISGGGDGVFSGDTIMAEDVLANNGIGAPSPLQLQTVAVSANGTPSLGEADKAEEALLREIEKQLSALSGESMISDLVRRHIVTRLSDEGLIIELFDTDDASLFAEDTSEPDPILHELIRIVADVAALAENRIAVSGHVRSYPVTLRSDPVWDLSTARAEITRQTLVSAGLDPARVHRVAGHADRRPATVDPTARRNNRIEIVLLRRQHE